MREITLQLDTLACPSCGAKIEQAVNKVEGVKEVKVLFNSSQIRFIGEDKINEVLDVVQKLGYPVLEIDGVLYKEEEAKKGFFSKWRGRK